MIYAEDLRIGDIVQINKDCMFPKDTLCIVTVTPEILRNNGFKEEVEGKYFTRPIKARAGSALARYLAVERKKYAWAIFIKYYNVTGFALLCHIKYVHELQLALKIVKFSPEMKV